MSQTIIPRPGLLDIKSQLRGDATPPGYTLKVGLSANENPLGPSPKVIKNVLERVAEIHKYPNATAGKLRQSLADFHGIHPDQISCTTGSEDALTLLIRAFAGSGDEVVYSQYGFLVFGKAALSVAATPIIVPAPRLSVDLESLIARVSNKTKIVLLDNPSNPIGTYINKSDLIRLREALPDHVLLVLDSAYAEYMTRDDYTDGIDLVQKYDNVVMTRTFSKFYGLAGMRLGWIYGPPYIIEYINRIRAPFGCNVLAQHAGVAALEDSTHQQAVLHHHKTVHPWFSAELKELGLKFVPSVTNFILVEFPSQGPHTAEAAFLCLAEKGYIVFPVKGYGLTNHLRITLGLKEDMDGVVQTLRSFLNTS